MSNKTLAKKWLEEATNNNLMYDITEIEKAAVQKTNHARKEETAFIFKDGSAIIVNSDNNYRIRNKFGFHRDNINL